MEKIVNELNINEWNVGDRFYWVTNEFGIISKFNGVITEKHNDHLIGIVGQNKDISVWIDNTLMDNSNRFIRVINEDLKDNIYIQVEDIKSIGELKIQKSYEVNKHSNIKSYITYDVCNMDGDIIHSLDTLEKAIRYADRF